MIEKLSIFSTLVVAGEIKADFFRGFVWEYESGLDGGVFDEVSGSGRGWLGRRTAVRK